MISWVAPVNPSHPYLENAPAPSFDPHHLRISPWLWFSRFSASQLRTLQRRLQDWRTLNCPDQEVYFPQEHPPGREAQFDFTHGNSLEVTIAGHPPPPSAVPADPQPLWVALRRGRHRGDLPSPQAGIAGRPVGVGRRPRSGAFGQCRGPHPRDTPQPGQSAERQLRRPAGPLRAPVHPHQPGPEPRERRRRAGPLPPQGRHRPGHHPEGQPELRHRRRLRGLCREDGRETQPAGPAEAGAGTR